MWWLGWLLAGLATAAVVGIVVYGLITKQKIREQLAQNGIKKAIVNAVDNCSNVVILTDLENNNTIEVRGDGVSYDIRRNDIIVV